MTPQTSAKPPSIVGGNPEYYHDHHQSAYYQDPSNPISALESPTTPSSGAFRMRSFRFPQEGDVIIDPGMGERRMSTGTGEFSLEYDSDGEIVPMSHQGKMIPINPHPIQHSQSQPGQKRVGSFTNSGTKSSDTMCAPGSSIDQTLAGSTPTTTLRRHYSDGPFVYNRQGHITRFADQSSVDDRSSRGLARTDRHEGLLHPYVSFIRSLQLCFIDF